ncbi:DUF1501 domain-containing protein [Candidatus Poribacteria bacterium]|nr:DUF1501 domain-containing protein [Candidatus Poribacteria bacterium]
MRGDSMLLPHIPQGTVCRECSESPEAHEQATLDRRAFLRRSLGGLIGLTVGAPLLGLPGVDNSRAGVSAVLAGAAPQTAVTPSVKSVIVLWMDGGPSQTDTFDPKPNHANGGSFKAIGTAVPGVMLSEHLPQVSAIMDRLAVIRCMSTSEGNHARARQLLHTGFKPNPTVDYPGLGAIMAAELGDPESPIPQNVAINAPGAKAGVLGIGFDPFPVRNAGRPVENLSAARGIGDDRLDRRIRLMKQQDAEFAKHIGGRSMETEGHGQVVESALRFMRAEQAAAFDISSEPESVKAAYGDSEFGRGCLMARRLAETGVRFVEVNLPGWDTHDDNFTRGANLMADLDPAMASLIKDLEARDLLRSTLVLCMGEFGRTPRINERDGRDHFASAWSVALAGGGIRAGQVIGETSSDGMEIRGRAISTADLFRTILVSAGIDPDYEYYSPKGRPMKYADGGTVIGELVRS